MRLSPEQVKEAILEGPDKYTRFTALQYFAESFSADPGVMQQAMRAFERYGRSEAFTFTFPIARLAQTDESIQWALGELDREPRTEAEHNLRGHIGRLLCLTAPELLQRHQSAIFDCSGLPDDALRRLQFRFDLLSWDAEECWRELEAVCEEGETATFAGDFPYAEAEQIVDELAWKENPGVERMMAALGHKTDDDQDKLLTWMQPLMIRLAGELRHEPAVPLIVNKMHQDYEVDNEAAVEALTKIGTDSAVEAIKEVFPAGEWHFRLYASGALERIHSDAAVAACTELLEDEADPEIREFLAESLVAHFSFEGNELARQILLEDPDATDLKQQLVAACTLMGQEFPELDQWRQDFDDTTGLHRSMSTEPARQPPAPQWPQQANEPTSSVTTPVRTEKKVGRNDPCPCGSGKKYKKCCLRN